MAAYRADIEIGVKGIQQLQAVTKQINSLSAGVDGVNKRLAGATQSIDAYNSNLAKAEANLRKVNAGTLAETDAVRQYVQALGQANAARDRQNRLIQEQILLQRKAVPTANAGFGVQGPALPPGAPAARGRQAGGGLGGRIGGAVSGSIIGGAFPLLFGQGGGAATGGAVGGLVGGLAGPGGSFAGSLLGTLIGDIASKGQQVKKLGEDLGFSADQADLLSNAFKTANTDVEKFTATVQNIRGLGLDLEDQVDALQLVTALTEKYGGNWEKIGNAITSSLESGKVTQGTLNQLTSQGITIQDALAAKYGVSRDEILKLAKDGTISVQTLLDTLVDLGNASVTAAEKVETPFQKAIGETVAIFQDFWQQVQTIFAGVSGRGTEAATKLINIFNTLLREVLIPIATLLARVGALLVNVVSTGVSAAADLVTGFRGVASAIGDAVNNIINMIPGLRTVVGLAGQLLRGITGRKSSNWNDMPWPEGVPKPGSPGMIGRIMAPSQAVSTGAGKAGPKPPEDRTQFLLEDLEAMKLMAITQDGIRDALFEGNKELAIRLEYDQKVADINRDTAKALLNANYESEKAVIRAQEIVRIKDAQLERDDQLRDLARDINETIQNTLDDLRGGVTWDDTGLREIFDLRLPDAINQAEQNIKNLTDPTNQIINGATAIGDAFADSFAGIASGALTAREGLANFFSSVGRYFIDLSATIIAEVIKLQAIKLVSSLLGPLLGGGFGTSSLTLPGLGGAGALSSGPLFPGGAFAEGGFVTGPTRALIGEGGEPEYVIPASKMGSAMARYAAGARGEGVLGGAVAENRAFLDSLTTKIGDSSQAVADESSDGTVATRAAIRESERFQENRMQIMSQQTALERRYERERLEKMTSEPGYLNVKYESQVINNVEYVTRDQAERLATQSALRGRELAIGALQNSVKTRKRVGMS